MAGQHSPSTGWFCRKTVRLPTWRTWLAALMVVPALFGSLYLSRQHWMPLLLEALVHDGPIAPADALIVENYGQDYLVFEMAAELLREGYGKRVFAPAFIFRDPTEPSRVAGGFVEVMTRVARLPDVQVVPVREQEPITLSIARQLAEVLVREEVRSVIVIAPYLRSRRSNLVYQRVLEPLGIRVYCRPSRSSRRPDNWWHDLHGYQEVGLETLKYWYYRIWVLG